MIRDGVARYTATPARLVSPLLATQAWACLQAGDVVAGLAAVERAFDLTRSGLDRMFEAELWRLQGELLLARDEDAAGGTKRREPAAVRQAEECFEQALATSRAQGARSLELRAISSLARLWQERGEGERAHRLLASPVARFGADADAAETHGTSGRLPDPHARRSSR
jgi:adenylate cyclase